MIVLDASAVLEFLLHAETVPILTSAMEQVETIASPVILDFEILNVLRRQIQDKLITQARAEEALALYWALPFKKFDTSLLVGGIWKLRNNFTAYDASYIALAELLDISLYTKDKKWRDKPGHNADIRFI